MANSADLGLLAASLLRLIIGDTSLESQPRSERPPALNDDDLRHELKLNPNATTCELAKALNCNHHAVEYHLYELGYRKVLARWIPHILTDASRALPREETPPTQPKLSQKNLLKVLLCRFWDEQGMLFCELLYNETINAYKYLTQLTKLCVAIKKKRRRRVNVVLLHDNARLRVASDVRQQLENLGWKTI